MYIFDDKLNKKYLKLGFGTSQLGGPTIFAKKQVGMGPQNNNDSIIKIYDSHNILILPSFTEGHPQVLDESLLRLRPVIVFEEISHVIGDRKGIFVSERNPISLSKTINHIMTNYYSIEKKIIQNVLPTKDNFLKQMSNIIREN